MHEQGGPIRLTNKTAIALRHAGVRSKNACIAVGVVVTLCLSALAVYLGIRWLPAVPIFVVTAVFIDVILYLHGDRLQLSAMAQAVAMEEAMRALRESDALRARKRQAEQDRREAMEDAISAVSRPRMSIVRENPMAEIPIRAAAPAEEEERGPQEEETHRRRRARAGSEEKRA